MGYIKHHAIIVTSYDRDEVVRARKRALQDFKGLTTPIKQSDINSWWSFAILPDGSKEGWAESNMFDGARDRFSGWVINQRYEDGSNSLDAVEVSFDEEGETKSKMIN